MLGSTLEEQALVDQWLEVEAHNYNDPVFNIVLNIYILPHLGLAGDMEQVEKSRKKLAHVLDTYEKRLGESKYLAGDYFTLADLSHLPGTNYLITEAGMGQLIEERKNVKAWWEKISGRPAWKKLLANI